MGGLIKVVVFVGLVVLAFVGVRSCQGATFVSAKAKQMSQFEEYTKGGESLNYQEIKYAKTQIIENYEITGELRVGANEVGVREVDKPWELEISKGVLKHSNPNECKWTVYIPTLRNKLNRKQETEIFFYCFKNHDLSTGSRCRKVEDFRFEDIGCNTSDGLSSDLITKALNDQEVRVSKKQTAGQIKSRDIEVMRLIADVSGQIGKYVREYSENIDSEYAVSPNDPTSLIRTSGVENGILEYELEGCRLLRFEPKTGANNSEYECLGYNLDKESRSLCPKAAGLPGGFFISTSDCVE